MSVAATLPTCDLSGVMSPHDLDLEFSPETTAETPENLTMWSSGDLSRKVSRKELSQLWKLIIDMYCSSRLQLPMLERILLSKSVFSSPLICEDEMRTGDGA